MNLDSSGIQAKVLPLNEVQRSHLPAPLPIALKVQMFKVSVDFSFVLSLLAYSVFRILTQCLEVVIIFP